MTIIYLTEFKTKCYGVTFENKGWIKVQNFEDISDDKNFLYKVNPMETFSGKNESCMMTSMSGAFDKSVFDGNTILLKISEENDKHVYLYIGGDMVCSFLTNDKNYEYISNMGNNLTPYSIAMGGQDIYFLNPNFNFTEKEIIRYDDDVELFDYCNSRCGKDWFKKLKTYKISSSYD